MRQIQSVKSAPVVIDVNGGLEDHGRNQRCARPWLSRRESKAAAAIQVIAHPGRHRDRSVSGSPAQSRRDSPVRGRNFRARQRARQGRHRGIAKTDRRAARRSSRCPKTCMMRRSAFNILPEYGSDSPHTLAEIELKIDRHLASLLATDGSVAHAIAARHACAGISWLQHFGLGGIRRESRNGCHHWTPWHRATSTSASNDHEPPSNVGVAGQARHHGRSHRRRIAISRARGGSG